MGWNPAVVLGKGRHVGHLVLRDEPVASCRVAAEADTDTEGAAAASGAASVPTGDPLPSAAKPQSSSFSAAVISVSAGQCSRVTMSVTPCRVAIPT